MNPISTGHRYEVESFIDPRVRPLLFRLTELDSDPRDTVKSDPVYFTLFFHMAQFDLVKVPAVFVHATKHHSFSGYVCPLVKVVLPHKSMVICDVAV